MIVVVLKQDGTMPRVREMFIVMFISSEPHSLRTHLGMLSGPAALSVFTLFSNLYNWVGDSMSRSSSCHL